MQTCIKCGFENPDGIKFCGSCGNDLAQPKPEKPAEKILAQSESYSSELERRWEGEKNKLIKLMNSCCIIGVIACLLPLFGDLADDRKFSYAFSDWMKSSMPWAFLIFMGVLEFCKRKIYNEAQSIYSKWKYYCQKESLVVSNTKVFGSADDGKAVQLSYKNIKSVATRHYTNTGSLRIVSNDILEIRDVGNRVLTFHSFTNARKLQTMIEMQKREQEN